ncbi:ankyrin repeat and protein kinase domain-containing protein 1-like isoform X2 [Corticium candelabrum]|uniref:ankyrin repeat and protein kinase domain-containing protein 1-like isoform X2 n=1 Tax=Corticium candelabrum TaxID=121492 RepID=UPI002E25CA85|nr:ankyrin repeat and protein kinase domain-containing protein 1-like isoform X2 [Corticium candelabrum]
MALEQFKRENFQFDRDSDDDFLGAGSFGVVFKATIIGTGQVVALKILNTSARLQKSDKEQVQREACIMCSLRDQHVNIVGLLGVCLEPGCYALVLEYMRNGSVDRVMRENETPAHLTAWEQRIRMGLDVACGMEFLHSHQPPIAHRDLKSANVLLDDDYRCKVSDFGLAVSRSISNVTTSSRHNHYHPAGTLAFIAPEKFKVGEGSTNIFTGDVYSFSIILWQIKEMKQPFREGNYDLIRGNVIAGCRPLMTSDDGCPVTMETLIKDCWQDVPEKRPTFPGIVVTIKSILERQHASTVSPPGLFHREVVPDGTMVAPPVLQAACRPVVEQIELAANTLATPQPLPEEQEVTDDTQAISVLYSPDTVPHEVHPVIAIPCGGSPLQLPSERLRAEVERQLQPDANYQRAVSDAHRGSHETGPSREEIEPAVGRHDGDNVIAKEVFRVIQRHGSARYPALATEMGFNNNKITTTTAHCITPEDKLQAIFNVEASAVGSFATTKSMLRACSRIVHPIFGIVAEELRRDARIPRDVLEELLRV